MDAAALVLWGIGGVVALSALVRIMTARRNQVVAEWQTKAAAERKNKKKGA